MAKQVYPKEEIKNMIVNEALAQGVDPRLALALAKQESGYNPYVTSSKGAMGVMQLMPNTAKGLGVKDPYDPQQNIRGGIKLLAGLTKKYGSDTKRILAAYNAGSGAVDDYLYGTNKTKQNPKLRKNVMPYDGTGYKETKGYVNNILAMLKNQADLLKGVNRINLDKIKNFSGIALGGGTTGLVGAKTGDVLDAFKKGYAQQSDQDKTVNPNNTPTGEAAMLPEQPMTGYEALQNAVSLPDISTNTPVINAPSGISTATQAQDLLGALPSQLDQDYRNMVNGFISPQQFVALHANELQAMGIKPEDLPNLGRFTPQALTEADRIAKQVAVTPEQINQVQQQAAQEVAKQREFAAQQGQGMVDRLNQLQQQYNEIINSDPRLQTGQGYYVNPNDIESNLRSQLANQAGGYGMKLPTAEEIAAQRFYAQRSNELGVPYADYLAAKQQAIQNQMAALKEYQQLQGNINTNQAGMVNELSKVVQKANELGIGALTENEKQLVELYKPVLQQMTSGEYDMQKTIAGQPIQITNANLNTRGNLYGYDVDAMTSQATNAVTNQTAQQRNAYDYLINAQRLAEEQRNAPFTNLARYGTGLTGIIQAGQDPNVILPAFGINVPNASLTPTQQPKQGLNWGG